MNKIVQRDVIPRERKASREEQNMTQIMKYRVRVMLLAGLFAVAFALTTAFAPVAQAQGKKPVKIGFGMALTGAPWR